MNFQALTWAMLGLCVILASIAIYLLLRLRRAKNLLQKQLDQRTTHWRESARIVALAVVQQQCDLSEGCLRLRFILNQLGDHNPVLEAMGEELMPFATHEKRQQLDVQERWRQDLQRSFIEEKYREELLTVCREITATYDFRGA